MSDCRCGRNCRGLEALIDCSDEGREKLRQRIEALEAQRFSIVNSLSDRSRSVAYARTEIPALLNELLEKLFFCEFGYWPAQRRRRLWYAPLMVKGL